MANAQRVCVIGAGSWGTALALHLARNGQDVVLWGRDADAIQAMQTSRHNQKYLPDAHFPDNLVCEADLKTAIQYSTNILVSVPSHAFMPTIEAIQPFLLADSSIVWATKGIESASGDLLSKAFLKRLGIAIPFGILSGPTFAKELGKSLPTAITLATTNDALMQRWTDFLKSDTFRVYMNHDVIGVQIGGAVKNVIAVAAGMADGLGFGANARTALITRGLAEMTRLGQAVGGEMETFIGMAGMGDLVLTCTDNLSRNRRFGIAIGKGQDVDAALAEIGQVVEGLRNTKEVLQLAKKYQVEMPITEQLYQVLYNNLTPKEVATNLLTREVKIENTSFDANAS
jgi:glycerol-3-phosphate dehydrogenase (NAD(P)+)